MNNVQSIALRIVASPFFNRTILAAILFSAVLLGIETDREIVLNYSPILKVLDGIVLAFFVFEIVAKVLAKGAKPWTYFSDPWNTVDFFIVAACLVPTGSNTFAIFRLIRVLRILRLVTALPKLQHIVSSLLKSLPSMGYVGSLLFIHFYMFAVLGTFLFSANDPVHFGTLGTTLLSLFQILTLEGWADIMRIQIYGCSSFGYEAFQSLCTNSQAQPIASVLYFVSFIVIGTMIILNLLIGVVLSGMSESQQEAGEGSPSPTSRIAELEKILEEVRTIREDVRQMLKNR